MNIQFQLSNGKNVVTKTLDDDMVAQIISLGNPHYSTERAVVKQVLELATGFTKLVTVTINGVVYNPQQIVSAEVFDHEWAKERYPDLNWPDND